MLTEVAAALEAAGSALLARHANWLLVESEDGSKAFVLTVPYQPEDVRTNKPGTGAILATFTPPVGGKLTVEDGPFEGKAFMVRPQVFIHGKPGM